MTAWSASWEAVGDKNEIDLGGEDRPFGYTTVIFWIYKTSFLGQENNDAALN